jgi:hypothetical protein
MHMSHIGHSTLHTPHTSMHPKNLLHVPSVSKYIIYVYILALEYNAFLEFHPYLFLIKDLATRRIMFNGPCHGLYPLVPFSTRYSKQVFTTINPPSSIVAPLCRTYILACGATNF